MATDPFDQLRITEADLQRIVPIGSEIPSVTDTQAKGTDMVIELNRLNAGKPPASNPSAQDPTEDFLEKCEKDLFKALQQIGTAPAFKDLRIKIEALKAAVGVTQAR